MSAPASYTGERFVFGATGHALERQHIARYRFASGFANGKAVLDIACGSGYGASLLKDAGASRVIGVDIHPETIALCKREHVRDDLEFAVGDIATFRADCPVELITCFETIEHTRDYEEGLKNLNRNLKGGGVLLISTPNRMLTSPRATKLSDPPRNPYHTQEFLLGEISDLLSSSGFRIEATYGQTFCPRVPFRFLQRVVSKLSRTVMPPSGRVVRPSQFTVPRFWLLLATKPA
jgi:O-antigen biosynthesis protein